VIKRSSTVGEDSWRVGWPFLSINGNGNWLFVTSRFKCCGWWFNIGVGRDGERVFGARSNGTAAEIGLSCVGIRWFGTISVFSEITESLIHGTSVTSLTCAGQVWQGTTRDEFLFREISNSTSTDSFKWFGWSDGGESPARSTLSLIFNGSNFSGCYPIDRFDESFIGMNGCSSGFGLFESKEDWSEFFFGIVRELVFSH